LKEGKERRKPAYASSGGGGNGGGHHRRRHHSSVEVTALPNVTFADNGTVVVGFAVVDDCDLKLIRSA